MIDPRARLREWLASDRLPAPADAADAEALVEAAAPQGLVALLHEDVAATGDPAWPPHVRERLASDHRRLLARGVGQLDLMARVDALLHARGLRVLALKGAALAEAVYASAAERPMADVDVLAIDDWTASTRTLMESGFTIAEQVDHAWSFVDPATGTLLELHRTLTSCGGVFTLDRQAMWARARVRSGQVGRVPAAEDLLVSLAQHAMFQHGGVLSLVQWLDFRRMQERDPAEPAALAAVARSSRASVCLQAALAAAAILVGAPAPSSRERLPRGIARWLDEVRRDPLRALRPSAPPLARLRWALAEGRRIKLIAETLRPPSTGEGPIGPVATAARTARRAFGLVRRWGTSVLR